MIVNIIRVMQMIAGLYSGGKDSTLAIHRMHDIGKEVKLRA